MSLGWLHLDHTLARAAWMTRRGHDDRRAGLFVCRPAVVRRVELDSPYGDLSCSCRHRHRPCASESRRTSIARSRFTQTCSGSIRSCASAIRQPLSRPVAITTISASIPGRAERGSPAPPQHTGLYHFAILYPTRRDLATAVRRVIDAGVRIQGVADHGVSESIYLADPDGNGIELTRDRPRVGMAARRRRQHRACDGGPARSGRPVARGSRRLRIREQRARSDCRMQRNHANRDRSRRNENRSHRHRRRERGAAPPRPSAARRLCRRRLPRSATSSRRSSASWQRRAPSASAFPARSPHAPGLVKNANSTWLIGQPLTAISNARSRGPSA